jgi:hypothetical protein
LSSSESEDSFKGASKYVYNTNQLTNVY